MFPVSVTGYSAFRTDLFYDTVSNKSIFRPSVFCDVTQLIMVVIYRRLRRVRDSCIRVR